MDILELKKEQLRLAPKIVLNDGFNSAKIIAGTACLPVGEKLLAMVITLRLPSFELLEKKSFLLDNPLPYKPGFLAYREMPAIIEAYNLLEEEPDVILVLGAGIMHPRKIGLASHLGLALNKPTIGVTARLLVGEVQKGKIIFHGEIVGFEVRTREHANPLYVSPGHYVSLGSSLKIVQDTIRYPHKLPEPLHIAQRLAKKKMRKLREE